MPIKSSEITIETTRRDFFKEALLKGASVKLAIDATAASLKASALGLLLNGCKNKKGPSQKTSSSPQKNCESNYRMCIEIDGVTFVSNSVDESTFVAAYTEAKTRVGGPHPNPNKKWEVEFVSESEPVAKTIFEEGKIVTMPRALAHELAHCLLGVSPSSGKWPLILGELLAYSVNPEKNYRYKYEDLDAPFIGMVDHETATTPQRNFFYNMRNEALRGIIEKLSDEQRKKLIDAAVKSKNITHEELPRFMAQFGIKHEIFKKAEPGVQSRVVYGKFEDGTEYIVPIIYERLANGWEKPVNGTFIVIAVSPQGENLGSSILDLGKNVRNVEPIILRDFFNQLSATGRFPNREQVDYLYIQETNQKIFLK